MQLLLNISMGLKGSQGTHPPCLPKKRPTTNHSKTIQEQRISLDELRLDGGLMVVQWKLVGFTGNLMEFTLWWTYKKLLKMAIEIVDLPIKKWWLSMVM